MNVSVTRSKEEAQADYANTWVTTRNGTAMLCAVEIWASGKDPVTGEYNRVYIDFEGSRGVLNAGAIIPIAWMDELALEWCEKRNLMPKVLS